MGKIRSFIFGGEASPGELKQELDNCSFTKTILMLIVVIYHSILFWRGGWISIEPVFEADLFGEVAKWMKTYHVQTFTFVSGYIFYSLKYEHGKYKEFVPFLKNKAKRLIVPFVFVSVVWAIPLSFVADSDVDIIHNYLLGEGPAQLWFLLMLFWVFIVFWCLSDFLKKHDVAGAVVVFALYILGNNLSEFVPNIYQLIKASSFLIFFWMGFKFRQYPKIIFNRIPAWVWLIVSISVYLLSIYMPTSRFILRKAKKLLPFAVDITGVISTFSVLQKIAGKIRIDNKLFSLLKKHSMQIYFFHQQIIYVCIYLLNGRVNPYINAGVNFVVSISVAVLISVLLRKFKITGFLIGEK